MNMKIFLLLLWAAIVIIAACGSKQEQPSPSASPQEHVFSAQENALRKAKELNQVVEQQAQELSKKVDEATQ